MRDTQRLLERNGLPEQIKEAKQKEVKLLKKQLKKQKEAVRFELKYKKVKFTGKSINTFSMIDREKKNN